MGTSECAYLICLRILFLFLLLNFTLARGFLRVRDLIAFVEIKPASSGATLTSFFFIPARSFFAFIRNLNFLDLRASMFCQVTQRNIQLWLMTNCVEYGNREIHAQRNSCSYNSLRQTRDITNIHREPLTKHCERVHSFPLDEQPGAFISQVTHLDC